MRVPVTPLFPARVSFPRLLAYAVAAWALGALLLLVLVSSFERLAVSVVFTFGAPALTGLVAAFYFRGARAEEPVIAAIAFTAVAGLLDLLVVLVTQGQTELLDPAFGFRLSLLLVFGTTGLTGELVQHRHAG